MEEALFRNRAEAGQLLATEIIDYEFPQPLIAALPRGGVPIGYEIARVFQAPLTVLVTRKLGAPHNPELGVGAISEHGVVVLNDHLLHTLGITDQELQPIMSHERQELERRKVAYRHREPLPSFAKRTTIIVDDGAATGYTMLAAIEAARNNEAELVVVAVPVAAEDTAQQLEAAADVWACLHSAPDLQAVGQYYDEFEQVSDEEVKKLLSQITHENLSSSE